MSPHKRPLGDANVSSLKRKSLTFDMARIDTRSRIPVPSQKMPQVSPLLDLLHINKLLDMNDAFLKKSKHRVSTPPVSGTEDHFNRHWQRQKQVELELNTQLKDLHQKHEDLLADMAELRRSHKKRLHKVSDLKDQILSNRAKFDFTEDRIMKNVLHREQMTNLQIKELTSKLRADFDEAQFMLQGELAAAKNYKDEHLLQQHQELRYQAAQLEAILEQKKAEKLQQFKLEAQKLEEDMKNVLETKTNKAAKLEDEYQAKLEEFQSVEQQFDEVNASIKALREENQQLEREIAFVKENRASFASDKVLLLKQLLDSQTALAESKEKAAKWKLAVEREGAKYVGAREQLEKDNIHRRMLEDAIMEFEQGPRFYMIGGPKAHSFQKEFAKDITNGEVIDEFSCFLGNSVKRMANCTIFVSGHERQAFAYQILMSCFNTILERLASIAPEDRSIGYALRCVELGQSSFMDILDSRRPLKVDIKDNLEDIRAQKMVIESTSDLQSVNFPKQSNGCLAILSVYAAFDGHQHRCDFAVLDISSAPLNTQSKIILGQDPQSASLINYCHSGRSLHVSQPDLQLLESFESLRQRYQE